MYYQLIGQILFNRYNKRSYRTRCYEAKFINTINIIELCIISHIVTELVPLPFLYRNKKTAFQIPQSGKTLMRNSIDAGILIFNVE